jgi:glycogen(starch) synthase
MLVRALAQASLSVEGTVERSRCDGKAAKRHQYQSEAVRHDDYVANDRSEGAAGDAPMSARPTARKVGPVSLCVYTRMWRSGGTTLFAQELVGGLLDVGADVTFIAPPGETEIDGIPRPRLTRMRPPREKMGGGSRLARAVSSFTRVLVADYYLLRARFSARVFIVTIPDPMLFFLPALLLLRLTGARVILVEHDPVPHAWRLRSHWRWFEERGLDLRYRLSDLIVVLSDASRDKMAERYPRFRGIVRVCQHGVFPMGEPRPPLGNGTLLLFGTIRRNKGILEAMAGVIAARESGMSVALLVAGDIHLEEPGYAQECLDLARTRPDIIEMRVGHVSDDILPTVIAESDALLLPYKNFFSQSGVAILAASNARPVIASRAGGIATLLDEGMPAVCIEGEISAESITVAIREFMAVPADDWQRRALAYRDVILEQRAWPAIALNYVALANGLSEG